MFVLKLGLLTCFFYLALTVLFEIGLWAVAHSRGIMWFVSAKHPAFSLGAIFGAIFGVIWLISFIVAWWIVYRDLVSRLHGLLN